VPIIEIKVEDQKVKDLLKGMQDRGENLTPVMKLIGETVRRSVEKNFDEEGRPPWRLSRRALYTDDKTLTHTGRLRKSITYAAFNDRVEIGTNVRYAAVHQFGYSGTVSVGQHTRKVKTRDIKEGKKTIAKGIGVVRSHQRKMNIPARPFLMVQDEDWQEIRDAILDYIARPRGGTHE
jgi:phage virion morphogenesis protein